MAGGDSLVAHRGVVGHGTELLPVLPGRRCQCIPRCPELACGPPRDHVVGAWNQVQKSGVAVPADFVFLDQMIKAGHVSGSVLEIGSRDWQDGDGNMSRPVADAGLQWEGCDLQAGPGVDFTLDLLDDEEVAALDRSWSTVLLFNLLEHVYDPISALRNAMSLVEPGGACVVCGPAVWELHYFPKDFWRPMPDFYWEFAARTSCQIPQDGMTWILNEWPYVPGHAPTTRIIPVQDLMVDGKAQLPGRPTAAAVWGRFRASLSVSVQRTFNLTGRVNRFPNVGLGVVLAKPS